VAQLEGRPLQHGDAGRLRRRKPSESPTAHRNCGYSPGKWPDSAALLNRRLAALELDPAEIGRTQPQVLPDLQRVCTMCVNGRKCQHDLDRNRSDPVEGVLSERYDSRCVAGRTGQISENCLMSRMAPTRCWWTAIVVVAGSLWLAEPAAAQSPAAQRGLTFVRVHCAQCHAVDRMSESPLTIAPPFRSLHLKYPVENLERRFAEGITASHPTMPQFRLDPGQIADVLAYLKTLER
jgi:cytochrome c